MGRLLAKVARTDPRLAPRVHLVARPRQHQAHRPTQAELVICDQAIDITSLPPWQGFLYLAAVLDACSRRVVGWAMADHLRAELVVDALDMALGTRRPEPGLVHHSDSEYVRAVSSWAA